MLASGLEKHLGDVAIKAALGIITNLTSPLRRCRSEKASDMSTLREEGDDQSEALKSALETLEVLMGHLMDKTSERFVEKLDSCMLSELLIEEATAF